MIKLYAHPMSTCSRKALTALAELEVPYELVMVDLMKGEHKQPAHLARQPFGQVPAIDDDGYWLYESRAICRYLSAKAGDKLVPRDLKQRGKMEQWLSVEQSNFSPAAMKFIFHHVFQRVQEQGVLDAAKPMIEKVYEVLSKPLSQHDYLAGDTFSIADIGYMPYVEFLQVTPMKALLEKAPPVAAWWKRVSERPSWRKVAGRG